MSNLLIARRYAKALVEIGAKQGNLPQLQSELAGVTALVDGNADLKRLVQSPLILPVKKAEVFGQILKQVKVSTTLDHFFTVVAEAGRLNLLTDIAKAFAALMDEKAGVVEAVVSSAQPLSAAQTEALKATLAQRTGKTVRLKWTQDPSLLGGLKVQVGSTILDASLQGQLKQLKTQLLSA